MLARSAMQKVVETDSAQPQKLCYKQGKTSYIAFKMIFRCHFNFAC